MIERQDQLQVIQSKIYEIRGQKVMLDLNLTETYGTETKRPKKAVRRNTKRFLCDFMSELAKEEHASLGTQSTTSKSREETRYIPLALIEYSTAQLSFVLDSDITMKANTQIIRVFVAVRQMIVNPPTDKFTELQQEVKELKVYTEKVSADYNDISDDTRMQLGLINQTLAKL